MLEVIIAAKGAGCHPALAEKIQSCELIRRYSGMMLKSFECWLNISCVCLWWSGVKPDEAFVFFLACAVTRGAFVCRARAVRYRQQNREAVGGFFSQIGNLYMVHHLWGTFKHFHADFR